MVYRDSLGNVYKRLPARKPNPSAKSTKANNEGRKGRNKIKCARYRDEGRREKNKARRIARDKRKRNR